MAVQTAAKQNVAVHEPTFSERFTGMVIKEFTATVGDVTKFNEEQRRLAQHLFVKIDSQLNTLEAKRIKDGKTGSPIAWANVNMQKLSLDAMHRIELGLDALIPNHIHPIPYFNSKLNKYDLDLRIGYIGKDYYRRKVALDEPVDIIYELVYSSDTFVAKKKTFGNEVESFEFVINNPFDRGDIVGGFGYIIYENEKKNKLIIVTDKDFKKSQTAAKSNDFWGKHPVEMKYKTLVTRVTDKMQIDPRKVSASYAAVEDQELEAEIEQNANQDVIDVVAESAGETGNLEEPAISAEEAAEIEAAEKNQEPMKTNGRGPNF
jgi:recombination protein RecT